MLTIEPARPAPPPTPPDPPQPAQPAQPLAAPPIVVPIVEVAVAPPPEAPPLIATARPEPPSATPAGSTAGVASDAPPAAQQTAANPGRMHSAVFADANSCALPSYPASAARNGETGTTTLALLVGTDGRVRSARIEQSSGSRILDRAALGALSLCKFRPAMSNGVPQAGWAQMAYVWTLD